MKRRQLVKTEAIAIPVTTAGPDFLRRFRRLEEGGGAGDARAGAGGRGRRHRESVRHGDVRRRHARLGQEA